MKEASEIKYGEKVEGNYGVLGFRGFLRRPLAQFCILSCPGQAWDDIIQVMTSATVRFELLSTVHSSAVSAAITMWRRRRPKSALPLTFLLHMVSCTDLWVKILEF